MSVDRLSMQHKAITAKTTAFGDYVDAERGLVDLPHLSYVEVALPEYQRAGLESALMRVIRYHFTDIDQFGAQGEVVTAASSRSHLIYRDMDVKYVGPSTKELHDRLPTPLFKRLVREGFDLHMIALAGLRFEQFDTDDGLVRYLTMYREQASAIESDPIGIAIENAIALQG